MIAAGQVAYITGDGRVFRYRASHREDDVYFDVDTTRERNDLLRKSRGSNGFGRFAAIALTFALVLFGAMRIAGTQFAPPSPTHSAIAATIIAHNAQTQACVADPMHCGGAR
jgi:hypothetical protein